MTACKYSTKYKGLRRPRCNQGKGCDCCNSKYQSKQFWQNVKKLAALRNNIPKERRDMSGVRLATKADTYEAYLRSLNDRDINA